MAVKGKKDVKKSTDIKESEFDESHNEVEKGIFNPEDEVVKVEAKEMEESLPMSAVEELMKRSEERMENKFKSEIQRLKLSNAKSELSDSSDYVAELEEDWSEVPAVFFAYSINFSIHGDKKMGKSSESPQGAIKFKPIIRSKKQTRKGTEVISVSSVKINSKATIKWLRSHSSFGIAFFENMESALNIDSGWAQRLIEANNSIQRLSDQQIIARCRQEGIPIGTDPIAMRKSLVEHVAKRTIDRHNSIQYGELKKSTLDSKNRQVTEGKI